MVRNTATLPLHMGAQGRQNNVADPISRRFGLNLPMNIHAITRGTPAQPVILTPFQEEIIAGYENYPWFSPEGNSKRLIYSR